MGRAINGIMSFLSVIIMLLNAGAGIVGGIWLAILGQWHLVIDGILLAVVSTFLIGIAMMPMLLIGGFFAICMQRGNKLGMILSTLLSNLYPSAIMLVYCGWVFYHFARNATVASIIPALLVSYAAATGPWGYMASKESKPDEFGNQEYSASSVTVFLVDIGYIILMLTLLIYGITPVITISLLGIPLLISTIINTIVSIDMMRYNSINKYNK